MKPYYRSLAILLCFLTLLASTCKKVGSDGLKSVRFSAPFDIAINEIAIIRGSNVGIETTEINDNRCRADVQCFSAGDAKLKLNISGVEKYSVLSFCIGQCDNRYRKEDTLAVVHQSGAYTIILSEVNPYPGTGSEKKTAVFTIKTN